jgi:lambda family phage portal protein
MKFSFEISRSRKKNGGARNLQAAATGRLVSDWTSTPTTIDEELRRQLRVVRARSRQQARCNVYARKFIQLVGVNVVGPQGIRMQSKPRNADGTLDMLTAQVIEEGWQDWCESKVCDIERKNTFQQMQRNHVMSAARDGEFIVRMVPDQSPDNPYGCTCQTIDPELLDTDHNEGMLRGGGFIRMGIEYNSVHRPVAYHIRRVASYDTLATPQYGAVRVRVPADEIVHGYLQEEPGQSRGLPWMTSALYRLKQLGAYEDAAVIAARMGANNPAFIRDGEKNSYTADETDYAGNIVVPQEPGEYGHLEFGQELVPHEIKYPNGEFAAFNKAVLRGVSAGFLVSYNSLTTDLEGVNFSSIRAGLLEDRDFWMLGQGWMISDHSNPIFRFWLRMQLLLGTLVVVGVPLSPALVVKYRRVVWQGRRWQWVDPLKDVQARREEVDACFRSVSSVIRESGDDPDEVIDQIVIDKAKFASAGIEPKSMSPASPAADATPQDQGGSE